MNKTREKTPISWFLALKSSIAKNKSLQFSNKVSVSYIKETGVAGCDIIDCQEVFQLKVADEDMQDEHEFPLIVAHIDNRTSLYTCLNSNLVTELAWYLPLSKDKYRFESHVVFVKTNGVIWNNNTFLKLGNDSVQKNLLSYIENRWHAIDKESRKVFCSLEPETVKGSNIEKKDALAKYEPQNEEEVSENFTIALFVPYKVDHLRYAPPQVIADARHPEFESLTQAPKKDIRYAHEYNSKDGNWVTFELNP